MGDAAVYDAATIRAERDALKAEVEKLRDAVSWHRCSTHGDVDPTAWGCPECVRELRAEVALRKSEVELFRDELKARCDEVAKLSAAAAQMREALRILDGFVEPRPSAAEWTGICEMARNLKAALSTNADGNYVGVTGALEGKP